DTGNIYKVSTKDASCSPTSFKPGQAGFTAALGMGFSSNMPGSKDETLFVSDNSMQMGGGAGMGLAKIDLATTTLTAIGPYTGAVMNSDAELTGTGDAKLFGFFTTMPAAFGGIDKASGATPSTTPLPASVNIATGGFAFSFWGGDFWFYSAGDT